MSRLEEIRERIEKAETLPGSSAEWAIAVGTLSGPDVRFLLGRVDELTAQLGLAVAVADDRKARVDALTDALRAIASLTPARRLEYAKIARDALGVEP